MTSQKSASFIRRAILPSVTLLLALSSASDNFKLTAHAQQTQTPKLSSSPPQFGQTGLPKLSSIIAEDYDVQTTDGKRVKFAELLGKNQPVLIDFWATWCGPCRLEIPHLVELTKKYKEKGEIGRAPSSEKAASDAEKVRELAKKIGINYQRAFS